MFFLSPFKPYNKKLSDLYKKESELETNENGSNKEDSELHTVSSEIDEFIEGAYAKAVFSYYNEKKPMLIRTHTGEEIPWEDAFGNCFENVSTSLRHSLVGLVEGGGRYKLK